MKLLDKKLQLACASLIALLAGVAGATENTKPANAGVTDEVVVQGKRLYEIRAAMVEAEDRFFTRYNELNKVDDYDISCHMRKRTGVFHEERWCYPDIIDKVTSAEGRAILAKDDSGGRPRVEDPHLTLAGHVTPYKQNLLKLLNENPDLRALVKERETLGQRYESERKKRLNGKMARFEWSDHP